MAHRQRFALAVLRFYIAILDVYMSTEGPNKQGEEEQHDPEKLMDLVQRAQSFERESQVRLARERMHAYDILNAIYTTREKLKQIDISALSPEVAEDVRQAQALLIDMEVTAEDLQKLATKTP